MAKSLHLMQLMDNENVKNKEKLPCEPTNINNWTQKLHTYIELKTKRLPQKGFDFARN